MSGLSIQKELFCNEYIIDFNGTQAAIRAKYSAKAAKQQASLLLTSTDIKEKISKLINEKLGTERDTLRLRVLKELSDIAFSEIVVATDDDIPILLRLGDRIKALELLGKFGAMWTEKIDIQATGLQINVIPPTRNKSDATGD